MKTLNPHMQETLAKKHGENNIKVHHNQNLNVCAHNNKALKYIQQKLLELQQDIGKFLIERF